MNKLYTCAFDFCFLNKEFSTLLNLIVLTRSPFLSSDCSELCLYDVCKPDKRFF